MIKAFANSLLLSTVWLAGCSDLTSVDELPVGAQKGFIEFYVTQRSGGHSPRTVRIVVEEVSPSPYRLQPTEFAGVSAPRLQIAAVPGKHTYRIMHKNTRGSWPTWDIPVEANMLTRVGVEVKTTSYELGVPSTRYLDVSISIERPLPAGLGS